MSSVPKLGADRLTLLEQLLREEGLADEVSQPIQKRAIFSPAPQSFAQRRLWFLDQLVPGTPVYNIDTMLRLDFAVDAAVLERAINEIIHRHESLRTTFRADNGNPVQVIAPALEIKLDCIDLSDREAEERESEAMRLAAEECSRPFDLIRGPLIGAVLFKLAEDDFLVVARMHHIVCDGWSVDVFLRELSTLYDAFARGKDSPLPELPVQYADYAIWQREQLTSSRLAGHLAYWKKQLENAPTLQLPCEFGRPKLRTAGGATQNIEIPATAANALRELGKNYDATLFMTLLAAFQVLLSRYTGEEDIVVGSPVSGRDRVELEALIGFFVNNIVLRTNLGGNPTFLEVIRRVRATVLAAMAHAEVPFDKLVEDSHPVRDTMHTPLFHVVFALNPAGEGSSAGPDLMPVPGTAKFDLTVSCLDSGDGIAVTAEYSTDLFRDETIRRLLLNFRTLLEGIARTAHLAISELPLLTSRERDCLLRLWQGAPADLAGVETVDAMVERAAAEFPDRRAVKHGDRVLTYEELDLKANALAHVLRTRGAGPGTIVPVQLERSIELVLAELAVLKTGAAFAPIDVKAPPQRAAHMFRELGAPVLLTSRQVAVDAGFPIVNMDEIPAVPDPAPPGPAVRSSADTAYVIYTSGSTGKPKGVRIAHHSLINLILWHRRAYGITSEDRATLLASPAFDASVWEIWPYLACGAALYIVDDETRDDPAKLWALFAQNSITTPFVPTPLAEFALQHPLPENLKLRALLTGGDRLHRAPDSTLPFEVFNHYGPTENTVVSTWGRVEPDCAAEPHIGRPIDNVRVYVLDSNHRLLPVGASGELFLGGVGLAAGYLGESGVSKFIADPFVPGERLYATGDVVRWRDDGNLEFIGRRDAQIKIRGFRVELGEIESALAEHPRVREAAVIARSRAASELRLLAYVSLCGEEPLERGELERFLLERLPRYMVPSAFTVLDRLPLTTNGKVDREALPEALDSPRAASQATLRSKTEQQVAAIWRELLGVEDIGAQDNFFDLGGHSLLLISLQARLREAFGRPIAIVDLFHCPTVRALAAFLTGEDAGSELAQEARLRVERQTAGQREAAAVRARARERLEDRNERR